MKIHGMKVFVPLAALTLMAFAGSAQAYLGTGTGLGLNGTVTVFAASDAKGNGSGFGVSYATTQKFTNIVQDVAYTHVSDYSMIQYSALAPKVISSFPANIGLTIGYSTPSSGSSATKGLMTGVQAVLAKTTNASGLSLDIRISSLQKGFNPLKWVSNPDALIAGAGASYKF